MESKRCPTCKRIKGSHLYYKRKGKLSKECKACTKKGESWRKSLDTRYRREFDITLEEYEAMLAEQGGRCFICRKKPAKRRLAVDHDHNIEHRGIRQSVRGLLCRNCNEYLGHIGDDYDVGDRIQIYLGRRRPFHYEFR